MRKSSPPHQGGHRGVPLLRADQGHRPPKTAEKIFQAFGTDTLRILDEEPERLLSIPGISEGKLKKIQESYLANRGARDVVAFLVPHGVTPNRAVKVYQAFGKGDHGHPAAPPLPAV